MNRSIATWIKERNVCVDKEQRLRNLILVYGNYTNSDIQNIDTETLLVRVLKKINEQTIEYKSGGDISTTITKDYKNYVVTDELGNFTLVNNNPPPAKRPTPEALKVLLNNKPSYGNPETVRNYLNQVTRLLAELDSRTAPVQTELSIIATNYGSASSVSANFDQVTRERDRLLVQLKECQKQNTTLLEQYNEVRLQNGALQSRCESLQTELDNALSRPGVIVDETIVDTTSTNTKLTNTTSTNTTTNAYMNADSATIATQTDTIREDLTRNIAEQQLFEPNDTDRELRDCQQRLALLQNELLNANQNLLTASSKVMSLQQLLMESKGKNDQTQNSLEQQLTIVIQLQDENLRLQTDISELKSVNNYQATTISDLKQKLVTCEQTVSDYKTSYENMITEMDMDVVNIKQELAKDYLTETTRNQLQGYIRSQQVALAEANALNTQLRSELQECLDSNNSENLLEQIRSLTDNKTKLLQQIAVLTDNISKIERNLDSTTQELEHTMVTKNNEISGLRNQLNECRADLDDCNDKLDKEQQLVPLQYNESLCSQEFSYLFNSHKMFQVVKAFVEHIMTSINVPEQYVNDWLSHEILTKQMMDEAKDIILDTIIRICYPASEPISTDIVAETESIAQPVTNIEIVDNDIRDRSPIRFREDGPNIREVSPVKEETIIEISPVIEQIIRESSPTIEDIAIFRDNSPARESGPIARDRSPIRIVPNTSRRTPKYKMVIEDVAIENVTNDYVVAAPIDINVTDAIEVDEAQSLFNKRKLESPQVSPKKRNKPTERTKKPVRRRVALQPARPSAPEASPSTSTAPDATPSTSDSRNSRLPNYVTKTTITTKPAPPKLITISGTANDVRHMTELLKFYMALYLNYVKLATNTEIYIQYVDNVKRWLSVLKYYCKNLPDLRKPTDLTVLTFETNLPSGTVTNAQIRFMTDATYDALNTLAVLSSNISATEAFINELTEYDKKIRADHCSPDLPQLPALPDNLVPVENLRLNKESEVARWYSSRLNSNQPRENLLKTRESTLAYVDILEQRYGGSSRNRLSQEELDWYENASSNITFLERPKPQKSFKLKPRPVDLSVFNITGSDKKRLKQIKSILEESNRALTDEQIKNLEYMYNELEAKVRSAKKRSRKKTKPAVVVEIDEDVNPNDIITVDLDLNDDARLLEEQNVPEMLQQLNDQQVREYIDKDLEEDNVDDEEESIASSTRK
ncbi:hypothetical protein PsunGV_gp045 [Pseudalatia unipuncta granulovirus]|uniref:Uncharacterized protein n=1 Tax=Pseudalatia unipuncta granulosis virus TaxID=36355 RepID=B6S6R4_GVPU|nr:hypothetical protein PsunGV_gp045 [Pseudalatia unipuncta granulovirus]ACH69395.1 unknown [Pseudalatia unipuncta granulovirus]